MAYGLDRNSDEEERTVLVYDLGGTSLDVTVVTVEDGVFEVLGSERVEGWYGGIKMDGNVAGWVLKEVAARMGRGGGRGDREGKVGHMQSEDIMMLDPKLVRKVKEEVAESVKMALSEQEAVEIDVGELLTNWGGMERNLTMTRRDFEDVNHVLVYNTLSAVGRVLLAAKVWWNEVDDVIVVGGSGKIPMVRRVVERYFRGENMTLREGSVDPAEAVIFGAAIQAMVLSGPESEACTLGAFNVAPIAIGVETAGGVMQVTDNQTTLTLNIFQGNRPFTSSNHLLATIPIDLGSFSIAPNLPRGAPRISFTLEIDSNGVLKVFLGDLKDDREPIATIQTSYTGRSSEDPAKWEKIESQIEEAAQFEIEDEETRARLNARRELAGMLNVVRRRLWIVDADDREDVREEAGAVRDALRAAEVWLEEHWDVETNTAEEFVKEKELLSDVVSPILDIVDWVFVDELPPRPPGEGGGSEVGSHDEL
ncbi:hypothetical protein N0V85_004373 [Neurospora sp. IMI 360204]|nr:hypothetical protein N0V85_004373 [Neurospora sp. IMI 360204]